MLIAIVRIFGWTNLCEWESVLDVLIYFAIHFSWLIRRALVHAMSYVEIVQFQNDIYLVRKALDLGSCVENLPAGCWNFHANKIASLILLSIK